MKIKLYFIDTNKYDLNDMIKLPFLFKNDFDNAFKYKIEINKKEHLASSYLKNKYINKIMKLNEYDKPLADNIYFNVSHSYGFVIIGISEDYEIGVDIEKIREVKDDLIRYISNAIEYKYINDNKSFYQIWTEKESLVKCLGRGLFGNVKDIPSLPLNGMKNYMNNDYYSKNIINDEYSISITIKANIDFDIEFINEELNIN